MFRPTDSSTGGRLVECVWIRFFVPSANGGVDVPDSAALQDDLNSIPTADLLASGSDEPTRAAPVVSILKDPKLETT